MTDHIGKAATKIDLDALEKLADEAEANGTVQRIFEYRRNTNPAIIKALIADLREARGLLQRWRSDLPTEALEDLTDSFLSRTPDLQKVQINDRTKGGAG